MRCKYSNAVPWQIALASAVKSRRAVIKVSYRDGITRGRYASLEILISRNTFS